MKDITYTQCELKNGESISINWIPSKFAILNKNIVIKKNGSKWVITKIYSTITENELKSIERDYLNQRKASDI